MTCCKRLPIETSLFEYISYGFLHQVLIFNLKAVLIPSYIQMFCGLGFFFFFRVHARVKIKKSWIDFLCQVKTEAAARGRKLSKRDV